MYDSNISCSSIDDSFSDLDYGNPNSPIEVSKFEYMSEYKNVIINKLT